MEGMKKDSGNCFTEYEENGTILLRLLKEKQSTFYFFSGSLAFTGVTFITVGAIFLGSRDNAFSFFFYFGLLAITLSLGFFCQGWRYHRQRVAKRTCNIEKIKREAMQFLPSITSVPNHHTAFVNFDKNADEMVQTGVKISCEVTVPNSSARGLHIGKSMDGIKWKEQDGVA